MSSFSPGDIVKKRYGNKVAEVIRQETYRDNYYYCRYYNSKGQPKGAGWYAYGVDLVLAEPPEPLETSMAIKTLYSFKKEDGTTAYGTHIGTNSSNHYLIEEKGTGEIHVLSPGDVEEVLPYTFSASIGGKETHYVCKPDAVKKGDYLLYTNGSTPMIATVTAVDTKNKGARAKFNGKRLVLEDI